VTVAGSPRCQEDWNRARVSSRLMRLPRYRPCPEAVRTIHSGDPIKKNRTAFTRRPSGRGSSFLKRRPERIDVTDVGNLPAVGHVLRHGSRPAVDDGRRPSFRVIASSSRSTSSVVSSSQTSGSTGLESRRVCGTLCVRSPLHAGRHDPRARIHRDLSIRYRAVWGSRRSATSARVRSARIPDDL
jgi:hypothetical protein